MNMRTRPGRGVLALFLSLLLACSLVPAGAGVAFAEEEGVGALAVDVPEGGGGAVAAAEASASDSVPLDVPEAGDGNAASALSGDLEPVVPPIPEAVGTNGAVSAPNVSASSAPEPDADTPDTPAPDVAAFARPTPSVVQAPVAPAAEDAPAASASIAPSVSYDGRIEVGERSFHFVEGILNVPLRITVEKPTAHIAVVLEFDTAVLRLNGQNGLSGAVALISNNPELGSARLDFYRNYNGIGVIAAGTYTLDLRFLNETQDEQGRGGEQAKGSYPITVDPSSTIDGAADLYLKDGAVTLDDELPATLSSVTAAEDIEHGTVQVNTYFGGGKTYYNENIEVVFTPDEGYRLVPGAYTVGVASGNKDFMKVSSGKANFNVVASLVVHARFEPIALPLSGTGSEDDPYLVTSVEDFKNLADWVNWGDAYSGKHFKLTTDLEMPAVTATQTNEEIPWQSPGNWNTNPFSGFFDGDRHSVTLDIDRTPIKQASNGDYWPQSLFGYLDGATVQDLTIRGSVKAFGGAASIAQHLSGGSAIRRCANFADIYAAHDGAGGISGSAIADKEHGNSLIVETVNYGNVAAARKDAGGIVGVANNSVSITDCYNLGAVSVGPGESFVGAFAERDAADLTNCYHAGPTPGPGSVDSEAPRSYYLGGVAGAKWTYLTAAQLRDAAAALNSGREGAEAVWVSDYEGFDGVARGFPRLWWQLPGTGIPDDGSDDETRAKLVQDVRVSVAGGASAVIDGPEGTLQLAVSVLPDNADDKSVVWSVHSGSQRASVDGAGLLAALPGATDGTVVVRATAADGSEIFGSLIVLLRGQGTASGDEVNVTVGQTGGDEAGAVYLQSLEAEPGAGVSAEPGEEVRVYTVPAPTHYTAQLRYSTDGGTSYTALAPGEDGSYRFTMPEETGPGGEGAEAPAPEGDPEDALPALPTADVQADFIPIIWDGTMDVTWYDPDASVYTLRYAAQFAGAAALNNGVFTTYPVSAGKTTEGTAADLPDYAAYLKGMGVELAKGADPFATKPGTPSRLYGEFSATYRLNDSQANYTRTGSIYATARVVGEPAYVVARRGNGATGTNNLVSTNDWYNGDEDFNGKTVFIAADLDFGGVYAGGAWDTSSPLFMSLGGEYAMFPGQGAKTNSYAKIGSSFCGTLDGLGHSFRNVYAERYANTAYGDSSSIGIVGRLGVHDGDPWKLRPTDPVVRRVVFESGYVSARRSVGGIVGKIGRTTASPFATEGWPGKPDGSVGGIVEYCVNKATVKNTDSKGCGGIVGASWNGGLVQYCANLGTVTSSYACPTGGIVGSNEDVVRNCYSVGPIKASSTGFAMGIGTNNGGGDKVTDCWWLAGSAPGGGYWDGRADDPVRYPSVKRFGGEGDEVQELTAELLNVGSGGGPWLDDTTGINVRGGVSYPVLYFQSDGGANTSYTVEIAQPAHGTVSADRDGGRVGENVWLSVVPEPGWALDYFTVDNGSGAAPITGESFPLFADVEVSASMRPLSGVPLTFVSGDCWAVSAVKTGTWFVDGVPALTPEGGVVLANGDFVFEGDVLTFSAVLAPGATPGEESRAYTGEFSYEVLFGATKVSVTLDMAEKSVVATRERMDAAQAAATTDAPAGLVKASATPEIGDATWESLADVSWYEGHEWEASYTLTTPEQLAGLAKLVNAGTQSFAGRTVALDASAAGGAFSLVGSVGSDTLLWAPIGTAQRHFRGTLEGGGITVSDMTVVRGSLYSALIGYAEGATVRGITVSGAVFGTQYAAGVVARADGGLIEDCVNLAGVTATEARVGGIVGYASAGVAVRDCTNEGAVAGASDVGGVVGAILSASVEGCANLGAVTASALAPDAGVGGIVGSVRRDSSGPASVATSRNSGTVTVASAAGTSSGPAGGIAGYASGATLLQCASVGVASAEAGAAGGLVGLGSATELAACYARGSVSSDVGYAGGLAGVLAGASRVFSSYAAAAVSSRAGAGLGVLAGAGAGSGFAGAVAGSLAAASVYGSGSGGSGSGSGGVYYLDNKGALPATGTDEGGPGHSASALSSDALKVAYGAGGLGDAFRRSRGGANGGFPVLAWELADASALDASIAAATLALGLVRASADGRDVPDGLRWAPVDAHGALVAAVAAAVAAADDLTLSADVLAAAAPALDAALEAFRPQAKVAVVSRTGLSAKVSALKVLYASVASSADGRDVASGSPWATPAARAALKAVLDAAQTVLDDPAATQAGTDDVLAALSAAGVTFEAATGKGTKAKASIDKTALSSAVRTGRALLKATASSADGKAVAASKTWAPPAAHASYKTALAVAQAVVDDRAATQAKTDRAKTALDKASLAFKAASKLGTKAAKPSGGEGGGSGGDSGGSEGGGVGVSALGSGGGGTPGGGSGNAPGSGTPVSTTGSGSAPRTASASTTTAGKTTAVKAAAVEEDAAEAGAGAGPADAAGAGTAPMLPDAQAPLAAAADGTASFAGVFWTSWAVPFALGCLTTLLVCGGLAGAYALGRRRGRASVTEVRPS